METQDPLQILERLRLAGTQFHPVAELTGGQWQLDPASLELMLSRVKPGDRTLETGCGYSTLAFALAGATHTSVSPSSDEHERLRAFCDAEGISLETVQLVLGHSQDVLPELTTDPLDFVLIDGSHAFPTPFIDWFYACRRLRAGGVVMIDDTHIRTGEILRDFLRADTDRWSPVEELPSLAVFERTGGPLIPIGDWPDQPYCAKTRRVPGRVPTRMQQLRAQVRLRTRLRSLLGDRNGG